MSDKKQTAWELTKLLFGFAVVGMWMVSLWCVLCAYPDQGPWIVLAGGVGFLVGREWEREKAEAAKLAAEEEDGGGK